MAVKTYQDGKIHPLLLISIDSIDKYLTNDCVLTAI